MGVFPSIALRGVSGKHPGALRNQVSCVLREDMVMAHILQRTASPTELRGHLKV
jgi:hypothetical protein